MFDHFFTTRNNQGRQIKLLGQKQQQHLVSLDSNQTIEYFKLDKLVKPCNEKINNLKACDYVLADHNNKKILLCELKNSRESSVIREARIQLDHSEHIVSLFLNILKKDGYSYFKLIFSKRGINKRSTKFKKIKADEYTETNLKELNFNILTV